MTETLREAFVRLVHEDVDLRWDGATRAIAVFDAALARFESPSPGVRMGTVEQRPPVWIEDPAESPSPEGLTEAIAEGLHKAMCYGPTTLHNRLACERPQVYLALAEAAVAHDAVSAALARSEPPSPDSGTEGT